MGHQQQPNALNLDLASDFDPNEPKTRATPEQDAEASVVSRTGDRAQRPVPLESGIPAPPSSDSTGPRTESGLRPRALPESEQSIADLDAGWEELSSEPPPPISPLPPLPAFDLYGENEPPTERRDILESTPRQVVAHQSQVSDALDSALEASTRVETHPADIEERTVQKFVSSDIGDLDYELDQQTANVPTEWMDHLAQKSAHQNSEIPPAPSKSDDDDEEPHPADLDEGAVTSTMSALHPSIVMERERFEQERAQSESPTLRPPSLPLGDLGDLGTMALPPIPRPSPLGPLAAMINTSQLDPTSPTPPPAPPSSKPYAVFVPPPSSSQMLVAGHPNANANASANPNVPPHLRRGRPITWRPGRPEPLPKPIGRPLRPTTRILILVTIAIEVGIILAVLWRLLK